MLRTEPAHSAYLDEKLMVRVVINLLSNAVKFSPTGSKIEVSTGQTGYLGKNSRASALSIIVTDQGVGIPSDQLDHVFDKFAQSDNTRNQAGGTGLGLANCKEIVELHRGQIRAESPPAGSTCGTAIQILLPTDQPSTSDVEVVRLLKAHERWHMLVEDLFNQRIKSSESTIESPENHQICALGRRIDQQIDDEQRPEKSLSKLRSVHQDVHRIAAKLAALKGATDTQAAQAMLARFHTSSDAFVVQIKNYGQNEDHTHPA